jgi:hypothetical protein
MPRKSRGQLVSKLDERLTEERAEKLRELARELRRQQRAVERGELAPVCEDERDGQYGPGDHQ